MAQLPDWTREHKVVILALAVITSLLCNGFARADTGVQDYFRAGNSAAEEENYDRATSHYEEALNTQPDHTGVLNNYGNVLLLKEDYKEAEKVFRKLLNLEAQGDLSRAKVLAKLADSLLGKEEVEQARRMYLSALKSDSGLVSANYNLGNIYRARGDLDSAIRLYKRVLNEDIRHRGAMLRLANSLREKGSYESANEVYSRGIEYFSTSAEFVNEKGILKLRQGKLNEAERLFKRAVRSNGTFALAYSNLGQVYYLKNELDKAINNFERAVELDTSLADVYTDLGLAYLNTKAHKKSYRALQKAIRNSPKNVEALYNLALLYETKNQYQEAKQVYEKVLKLSPNHYKALNNLGLLVLEQQSDPEAALSYFEKAVNSTPDLGEAKYNMAYANYILENETKAAKILNSIVENADSYDQSLVERSRQTLSKMSY